MPERMKDNFLFTLNAWAIQAGFFHELCESVGCDITGQFLASAACEQERGIVGGYEFLEVIFKILWNVCGSLACLAVSDAHNSPSNIDVASA